MPKGRMKPKPKRCRHVYGEWTQPSDEPSPYQVCDKCGVTRFKGDREYYAARARLLRQ